APRNRTEEVLCDIWSRVLGVERVGVDDDFFDLGGHSLIATRFIFHAQAALGTEIPLRVLFEAPTVAGLAERVEAAFRAGVGVRVPPIVPTPREGALLPLSFAQARLWFIDQLEPGSTTYSIPVPLRLRGALDARALAAALTELVRRHETLRTVFRASGGEPVQVVLPAAPFLLPTVDLGALPEGAREAEVRRLAAEDAARPFDLARGPLLRTALVRSGEEEHALLVNMHHIVSDGWSLEIFFRELSALYEALAQGRPAPLAELPVQYADFAVWQRAWLSGETLEEQVGYWKERLAGAPPLLELPLDRPRPQVQGNHGASREVALPVETTRALRRVTRQESATPFMALLAAWQVLLGRYAAQEDVVVGTLIAGRTRAEVEPLIGFFANTLVLRADLSGAPGFRGLLGRVREVVLGAFAHQDLPFERLVEELAPERSLGHTPLFQALFSLQPRDDAEARLGEAAAEPLARGSGAAKFDLALYLEDAGERYAGGLVYRTELFEPATIERMVGHFVALVDAVAADPDRPLPEVEILGAAERRQLLEEWNQVEGHFAAERTLHALFADAAARAPDAVAVSYEDGRLAYGELDRRANRLAHRLRRLGVGPEARVGICLERSLEMPLAVLAVLKAGGAYVPLDPGYPAERLAYMLADSGAEVLVTEERLLDALPEHACATVCLDRDRTEIEWESDRAPEGEAGPESLAYVIYTSGSTGRPKGVMVTHANVVRLFRATEGWFGFGAEDVWT
ncbi:MAG TPA: condensation domain-containing protein, partial [Longimicrobiaceae bacterium]